MIVADPPRVVEVEECATCSKVLPARSTSQYTRRRALALLEKGFCICPSETSGGLASLAPSTQEIYRELIELSREPLMEELPEPVPVAEIGKPEDLPEVLEASLVIPEKVTMSRWRGRISWRRRRPKTAKVVELTPVMVVQGEVQVWTHTPERSTTGTYPIHVIDGGGVITRPQVLPKILELESVG